MQAICAQIALTNNMRKLKAASRKSKKFCWLVSLIISLMLTFQTWKICLDRIVG